MVGFGVKPWASGRDGEGVARGPSHSKARVVVGRTLSAAKAVERRSDCTIFVVDGDGGVVLVVVLAAACSGERQWESEREGNDRIPGVED